MPAADGYVDAPGERLPGPAEGDTILVARHGRPVAAIQGRTATRPALEEALRPAVRLALENERLAAEARFHLARVAESRSRIVKTADSARRSLERDLHDGAQQRLLAVLYRLRLAAEEEARAGGGPGDRTRGDLAEAVIEAGAALAELRDIAHGVFPATLESTGLAAALATLVERSGVPVRLEVAPAGRLPAAVERAAYWTVAAALAHAPAGVAQRVEVRRRGREGGGALTVRLRPVPALSLTAVSDRVGAIGGTVDLTDDAVEVVIPCG